MKRFVVGGIITVLAIAGLVAFGAFDVSAQSAVQNGVEAARGDGVPGAMVGDASIITTVTNIMLYIVGALSVIMIIFGGIRYAVSGGNASSITAAKNTILYAIVGLIIAFLAFAVVNWVLGAISPGGTAGFTNV